MPTIAYPAIPYMHGRTYNYGDGGHAMQLPAVKPLLLVAGKERHEGLNSLVGGDP